MTTFLFVFLFGLWLGGWLGAWLVWRFVKNGVRDGFELHLSDTGRLTWRMITKDGDK